MSVEVLCFVSVPLFAELAVSPGLMPRPSLSGRIRSEQLGHRCECRRG